MSFKATMIVNKSLPMTVLAASYEFTQDMDSWNRPNGSVCGGIIEVTISSDHSIDMLARWMLDDSSKMSGSIMFTRRDGLSILRTIIFMDAFCVGFKEEYSTDGGEASMTVSLVISANEIQVNSPLAKYQNNWFESSMAAKAAQAAAVAGATSGVAGVASSAGEQIATAAAMKATIQEAQDNDKIGNITTFLPLSDDTVAGLFLSDEEKEELKDERIRKDERRVMQEEKDAEKEEEIRQDERNKAEGNPDDSR